MIITPNTKSFTIRQEGTRVLLFYGNQLITSMPYQAALELADALRSQGKKAEEIDQAESIIMDQAILLRTGAPFGITNNPAIMGEAAKEAAWNTRLRRALPGGVKSQEAVGTPSIVKHKPRNTGG